MLIGNDFKRLETSHADIGFFVEIYEMTPDQFMKEYEKEKERDLTGKVVVSVDSDEELIALNKALDETWIPHALITDSGLTEFHGVPTNTCLGIGPYEAEEIDKFTGNLPLL